MQRPHNAKPLEDGAGFKQRCCWQVSALIQGLVGQSNGCGINAHDLDREVVRAAVLQCGRDDGVCGRIEVIGTGGNQLRKLTRIDVRVNAVSRQDEHIT